MPSSPTAGPSRPSEKEDLSAGVWPLGASGPQRSSSQRSNATSQSNISVPFRPTDPPGHHGHVPTASEAEARLDARLGGGVAPRADADVPLPPRPAAGSDRPNEPARRGFVPRGLRLAASALPRLPTRTTSLPSPPPLPGRATPDSTASSSRPGGAPKPPPTRLQRVLPNLLLWIISAGLLAGTGIGYSVAIRMNARQMAQDAANPPPQSTDPSDDDGSDDGDTANGLSSTAFLHTFFLLGIAFELTFLYRRTRALYIAWMYDPYYYYSPEAIATSRSRSARPTSHPRADNPTPGSDELKNSRTRRWARRAAEWALRIRPEKLRPREEALPTYVAALEVPGGWDEAPGQRARMTREERRLARTGSARGTGDVEDIEVERAWRLGGGRGPPTYGGDEVRQSVILLSGPQFANGNAAFPSDDQATPHTPGTPGSFGARLSRRVSDSVGRLSRRISAGLGIAPSTPLSPHAQGVSSAQMEPGPSPKLAVPREKEDAVPSPVRRAHHASVVLDLAHEFEVEADEKEALEAPTRRSSLAQAGPSGTQYASYTPRSSITSLDQAAAIASPRRTSWTNAHHRRRSSSSNTLSLSGTGPVIPPTPSSAVTSRLATVHESGRPSAEGDRQEEQEEVVV